jgi:hypothetical protein
MKNLKSYLYARFGSSINLEEEWAHEEQSKVMAEKICLN